jgi:predicted anti-sigma-YlaC factor YlaD
MWILHKCKQVAEQASENLDTPLTGMACFKLKVHLMMCKHCSRYLEQIALSSKTVRAIEQSNEPNSSVRKNVEARYRALHCQQKSQQSK